MQLVAPANPKFQTFASADGAGPIAHSVTATGRPFQSAHTDFFNFKTPLTVPAEQVGV